MEAPPSAVASSGASRPLSSRSMHQKASYQEQVQAGGFHQIQHSPGGQALFCSGHTARPAEAHEGARLHQRPDPCTRCCCHSLCGPVCTGSSRRGSQGDQGGDQPGNQESFQSPGSGGSRNWSCRRFHEYAATDAEKRHNFSNQCTPL